MYGVLLECMSGHRVHTRCPQRPGMGSRSSGTGVLDVGELPCGCWELNPGPLQEQPVLVPAEPSLQPSPPALLRQGLSLNLRFISCVLGLV